MSSVVYRVYVSFDIIMKDNDVTRTYSRNQQKDVHVLSIEGLLAVFSEVTNVDK